MTRAPSRDSSGRGVAGRTLAGEIQLARQPVFDPDGSVVAYQLVARTEGLLAAFAALDESSAAEKLLSDTFLETDVWSLTGGLPVHLRVPAELVIRGVVSALPPKLTVLQLNDDPDDVSELVDACGRLRAGGYRVALGGFTDVPNGELLSCVDVVKVDVGSVPVPRQHELIGHARRTGLQVVADHVDSRQQEAAARLLGFGAYQGRFFQQPALVRSRRLAGSRLGYLQLLRAVNAPVIDFDEVAEVIRRDLALAWKFLNYINASFFGWRQRIESINQGLVLLGQGGVQRWVSLVVVGELADGGPAALMADAICRARLCERIVERMGRDERALDGFLVGMFSLLDAMIDEPMPDLLTHVSLPQEVVDALLEGEGRLGMVLQLVSAYERGAWDTVAGRAGALGIATSELTSMYLDALAWAGSTLSAKDNASS